MGLLTGKETCVCVALAEPVEPLLHHVISVQGTVDTSKWYTGEVVGYDGIMHTGDTLALADWQHAYPLQPLLPAWWPPQQHVGGWLQVERECA